VKPAAKRSAVEYVLQKHPVGVTRSCGLMNISRSCYRYQSRRGDDGQQLVESFLNTLSYLPVQMIA